MTPTLVRQHRTHSPSPAPAGTADRCARARDWAEIQERMLVPLYDAVYDRLDVGPGTRLLGLGCGSGLALLMAAGRGAEVSGTDTDEWRLELARERLSGIGPGRQPGSVPTRLVCGGPRTAAAPSGPAFTMVTAFHPVGCVSSVEGLVVELTEAAAVSERGSPVVLGGWGPAERCASTDVLRVGRRLADPLRTGGWRPSGRDDLEDLALSAGLKPDGSGRVTCPFGYGGTASAVRGLLSTGLFDAALEVTDQAQVEKELSEALHPHRRPDGTVWMANVFRYLIARTV